MKNLEKKIYFDCDGTFVDLYGVENWLEYLISSNPYPYMVAKPLVNLSHMARLIHKAQKEGYKVGIISWLSKNSTKEYDELVTIAKKQWLKKHLPSVEFNEIHIVKYGTSKASLGKGILFDDEQKNRNEWNKLSGKAYNVENMLETLKEILEG